MFVNSIGLISYGSLVAIFLTRFGIVVSATKQQGLFLDVQEEGEKS